MAATDNYTDRSGGLDSPARNAFAVSPHDTNELTNVTRGLYIGIAGNLKVTTVGGDTVTFIGVLAGTIIPIRAKIIWSTGTTATSMLGLY